MGTIDHHFENHKWPTTLTTPDAIQLEHRVSEMVQLGAKCLAFEVSSHALAQRRVDGVSFDIGIFTNLTRDHLDYHKDMEDYFHAKERLFFNVLQNSKKNRVFAIINTDDEWGTKLRLGPRVQKISYGQRADDFRFKILKGDVAGTHFELIANREKHDGFLPMPGPHNVANAMAALAAASVLGVTIEQGLESLSQFPGVPGRLERVERRAPFAVFVDYAHTPDALENVVRTLRPLTKDLCVLFGCGGDRDKGKRPLMLQTALNGSDQVVLTSDNPRTEDPMLIIEDSLRGVAFDPVRIHVEVDRKKAIEWALNRAKAGSVVLIAGKGHEDYQLIGSKKLAFSDQKVVREILAMKWNLQ
jgi:UDP-N-acetylmuramoyl-L-alanyl-D-glutamate--2,6-diaminopimelate ligase